MLFNPLVIPAAAYQTVISLRNLAYDLFPGLSQALPVPVICIGNLTVGGTGKTPMVARLAEYFAENGIKPAILSRGYGRREGRTALVIPPGPLADNLDPARLGDEALMLKQMLPDIPLVLDRDRVRGGQTALECFQPDLLLMDDGFQHRRLRRTFNLVMIDGQRMFGNRRLLPAGPLREPLSALERADAVVINKTERFKFRSAAAAAPVLARVPAAKIFFSGYRISRLRNPTDGTNHRPEELKPHSALYACAGLANNDYFFDLLRQSGLRLKKTMTFGDHHDYQAKDLEKLAGMAAGGRLLTTAKDAVKLVRLAQDLGRQKFLENLRVCEIELMIGDEERFFDLLNPFAGDCRDKLRARP